MIKYIKKHSVLFIVYIVIFLTFLINCILLIKIEHKLIKDSWSKGFYSNVNVLEGNGESLEELAAEIADAFQYYYVDDCKIDIVAYFRGGSIGDVSAVFFSTLEECSVNTYNKLVLPDGSKNSGIDGYLKVKGINSLYKTMNGTETYGYYESITIDGSDYCILYAYSSNMHSVIMGFVPTKCERVNSGAIIILFIISYVIIVCLFGFYILSNKKFMRKLVLERDNAIKTMKDKDLRMDMLSYLMNEFTFEYDIKHDSITLSEKYQTIFQRGKYFIRFLENLKTRYNIYHLDQQNIKKSFDDVMNGKDEGSCLFRLQMPNGNYEWFNSVYKVMFDSFNEPVFIVGKIMNVHKAQTEKETLLNKSTRDPLTNLLNRSELEKRTTNYLNEMDDDDLGAIVIMDLDHFKQVNDTFGHTKGDALLIEAAGVIHDNFRTSDIVGRLGGDEFYIFMKDIMSEAEAMSKCETLRKLLDRSVTYGDTSVKISTSMGLHFVRPGDVFLDIYMKADSALYRAKEGGRNRLCVQREGDAINSSKG